MNVYAQSRKFLLPTFTAAQPEHSILLRHPISLLNQAETHSIGS